MTNQAPRLLGAAGPAQFEWLIHFCGRPTSSATTPTVPQVIRDMHPSQRLYSILWLQQIFGFAPFGSDTPMVCLSESPWEHLRWLIANRQWPPWGLLLRRQAVYDLGGGPVWYARPEQRDQLPAELDGWAVRFETGANRSDWLHEREWRIPVPPADPALRLPLDAVAGILVGDPHWTPTPPPTYPVLAEDYSTPLLRQMPYPPPLWTAAQHHWYWDAATQQIRPITP